MEEVKSQNISWSAPEYTHNIKNVDFLWTIGLLGLAGTITSIVFKSYMFAFFIILSSIMLIYFSIRHPKEALFEINTEGVLFDKELHKYKNIKGFKIKQDNPYSKLIIETDKYFLPVYIIPLPHGIEDVAYSAMIKVIPEKELDENLFLKIMNRIGF